MYLKQVLNFSFLLFKITYIMPWLMKFMSIC